MLVIVFTGFILVLGVSFSENAFAGAGHCDEENSEVVFSVADFLEADFAAYRLYEELEASDSDIAVIARRGSDISNRGLVFTHAGFAMRVEGGVENSEEGAVSDWEIYHVLNLCETGNSKLYQQGLVNFFMDDVYSYEFEVIFPSAEIGEVLRSHIEDGSAFDLHETSYSILANPFALLYANSNSWVLDNLALAMAEVEGDNIANTRAASQEWLADAGYEGTEIRLGMLELAGLQFSHRPNIKLNDHSQRDIERRSFETVTVKSIRDWLVDNNHGYFVNQGGILRENVR